MPLIQGKCTNCGSNIEFVEGTKKGICNHCDCVYIAEDVVNNYITNTTHNTTHNSQHFDDSDFGLHLQRFR